MQEHGLDTPTFPNWKCEVCGENKGFNWADLHGEGMCNVCGIPYDLLGEGAPCLNLKAQWLEPIKVYWNETHQYIGLGQCFTWHDYPECVKGRNRFNEWLETHKELIPIEIVALKRNGQCLVIPTFVRNGSLSGQEQEKSLVGGTTDE